MRARVQQGRTKVSDSIAFFIQNNFFLRRLPLCGLSARGDADPRQNTQNRRLKNGPPISSARKNRLKILPKIEHLPPKGRRDVDDDVSSDRSYRRIVWAAVFPSTCSSVDDDPTTLAPPCTIFILRELARAHTLIYIPIYCTRETFFFFQYFFFFLF